MDNFDLLEHVQPSTGWFCVIGIKGTGKYAKRRQELLATREEVDTRIAKWLAEDFNVFFGVAKYKTDAGRKHDNVDTLKAFWLDIDCAPGKGIVNEATQRPEGYEDRTLGLRALKDFCKLVGLPKPTVVNSGRGFHVYWVLEKEVTPEQWNPVAKRLRDVCFTQELFVDGSVFEASRILRVPGTLNFKQDPPLPVEVMQVGGEVNYDDLKKLLGVEESAFATPAAKPPRRVSALGQKLRENIATSFAKIMRRSGKGTGCAQLLDAYQNRATLSEPRWFDALSIAKFCKDASTAIQKLSTDHPDYDPAQVERKIVHILGPHSCEAFEVNNPGGCEGCPHSGKITNPLALGRDLIKATQVAEVVVEASPIKLDPETGEQTVEKLPNPPEGYSRGKNGGLYVQFGDDEPQLVYEHDIYVVNRMNDPGVGDVAVLRVHMPRDGVKEFVLPNAKITDTAELKRELSKQGVIGTEKQFKLISHFILNSIVALQKRRTAKKMRTQFGWADNDTKFIVGDREITADGVYHSPPSAITEDLVPYFQSKGSLEAWKKVWSLYGREGMELQAFVALSGFGSTLLKFTEQKGAVINLIHSRAGAGKTTVLRMINSVCGDPEMLLGTPDDTAVGRILKIGILNNICNTIDEMTNLDGKQLSHVLYAFSQGKGKDKGEAATNKLRSNNTTWRDITVTSSNASFIQKLSTAKSIPDGEFMRLLEFKVDYTGEIVTKQEGKDMFDHTLNHNYGHAIVPFMQYVIANLDEVKSTLRRVQEKIDRELGLTQRERNWSATIAANTTAGLFADHLGLLEKWDMTRIYKKVTPMLLDMRVESTAPVSNSSAVVGEYIQKYSNNMLVVDARVDGRTAKPKPPSLLPKGELLIRYEPDMSRMYFMTKHFKADCAEAQIDYKDTLKDLKASGMYIETEVKRMSKGMRISAPGVQCIVLDTKNSDFIDIEPFVGEGAPDAGGEGNV